MTISARGKPYDGTPFVLISGFLTTAVTVDAMKIGAFSVLEKPISIEDLLATVRSALARQPSRAEPTLGWRHPRGNLRDSALDPTRGRSVAERWAIQVLKACDSDCDLKTVARWAACAGVSPSSLREGCRLLGIRPSDARDFARVLRAMMQADQQHCSADVLLEISDRRTLKTILRRAGFARGRPRPQFSLQDFLHRQRFVAHENAGLGILRSLLNGRLRRVTSAGPSQPSLDS